jgi:hypothetical protein
MKLRYSATATAARSCRELTSFGTPSRAGRCLVVGLINTLSRDEWIYNKI